MRDDEIRAAADETRRLLDTSGAIVAGGHYVHISGLHLAMWLNKDAIFPHLKDLERLTRFLARRVTDADVDVVVGPAIGGLIIAEWVAHELDVMCAFAEHDPAPPPGALRGQFVLRRGYDKLVSGKRVLVVDDCVNTGHSIREVIRAVEAVGGIVVSGASIIIAGARPPETLGLTSFHYLYDFPQPTMWKAEDCPLCRDGVPVNTEFGHGAEFIASRNQGGSIEG